LDTGGGLHAARVGTLPGDVRPIVVPPAIVASARPNRITDDRLDKVAVFMAAPLICQV